MASSGVFDRRRVELIDGEIIQVAPQATPHRAVITKISKLLLSAFGPKDWVVIQGTLVLSIRSAPDPDFHIFDVPIGTPDDQLPKPLLVIEVSDSTYGRDRGSKLRTYAQAGIADYWIVNLIQRRVEVYRQPTNPTGKRLDWRYESVQFHAAGEEVRPLLRPQLAFPVAAMLP
ncbi:MAG TPA: Uma2 family endonuclease [Tepidisphaeraceae bacterium]|nr:Uma2 family endonuclease [Tepidisphaeraceae bacterium]